MARSKRRTGFSRDIYTHKPVVARAIGPKIYGQGAELRNDAHYVQKKGHENIAR